MRNREIIREDFEAAHATGRTKYGDLVKYRFDQHTRQEISQRLMLEVLLDIRELLRHPTTIVQSEKYVDGGLG